jgi:AraC-like DNA-binding protein
MSKRTLSRRLSDRNTSFREELFRVQEQLAKSYLEDNRLPLSEIAFLIGFENQSSFTRAFKRWTGETPKSWQRR